MAGCCRVCGVPGLLSMTQAWRDGCIIDKTSGSASLCIYEASYPTALIEELEGQLGIPLDRIVYLAGTHAAVKVLGVIYESHPLVGKLLFSAPLHRMTERVLVNYGKAIGVADVDIIERRRGNGARVKIKDPFDLSNCLAIISGILQVADGRQISYDILERSVRGENSSCLVEFSPASAPENEEEAYQRLFAENLSPSKTGEDRLARCRKCGAPSEVSALLCFDTANGLISERASGERMIFMGVHGFNAIIRELTWELGQLVNEIFIAFERKRLASRINSKAIVDVENICLAEGEGNAALQEEKIRRYLALRGLGYLSDMRVKDRGTSFTVENAFIAPLVAGRLLAFWDNECGREGSYEFDVTGDTLHLVIN